jgi:hypothetical protein
MYRFICVGEEIEILLSYSAWPERARGVELVIWSMKNEMDGKLQ